MHRQIGNRRKCNEIHQYIQDFLQIEKEKDRTIVFTDNRILVICDILIPLDTKLERETTKLEQRLEK